MRPIRPVPRMPRRSGVSSVTNRPAGAACPRPRARGRLGDLGPLGRPPRHRPPRTRRPGSSVRVRSRSRSPWCGRRLAPGRTPPRAPRSCVTASPRSRATRACAAQSTLTRSSPFVPSMLLNERRPARLEPVDHGEAAVVADDHDQLLPGEHRAVEVGVEHQVRAVADERDHVAVRARHPRAPRAGDLVAHARVAVLAVERARRPCASQLTFSSPGNPPAAVSA